MLKYYTGRPSQHFLKRRQMYPLNKPNDALYVVRIYSQHSSKSIPALTSVPAPHVTRRCKKGCKSICLGCPRGLLSHIFVSLECHLLIAVDPPFAVIFSFHISTFIFHECFVSSLILLLSVWRGRQQKRKDEGEVTHGGRAAGERRKVREQ